MLLTHYHYLLVLAIFIQTMQKLFNVIVPPLGGRFHHTGLVRFNIRGTVTRVRFQIIIQSLWSHLNMRRLNYTNEAFDLPT
jgi:hypothetical protein